MLSVNQRNKDSGVLKHGEGIHEYDVGSLGEKPASWATATKRDAPGDVGSYQKDLVMSVNQRNKDSGVLAHGEHEINTGGFQEKESPIFQRQKQSRFSIVGSLGSYHKVEAGHGANDTGLAHGQIGEDVEYEDEDEDEAY